MSPSDRDPIRDPDDDEVPASDPHSEPPDASTSETAGDEGDTDDRDEDDRDEHRSATRPQDRDRAEADRKRGPSTRAPASRRREFLQGLAVGVVAGAAGGFGAGWWYRGRRRRRRPAPDLKPALVPLRPHSPRKGPAAAKVTIVEFSEFQCPFCGRAQPVLQQLLDKYGDQVALVFRNRPLPFHKQARGAALALLAAQRQGKAWQLHDVMFENRTALARSDLVGYAGKVGLDVAQFQRDLDDPTVEAELKLDEEDAGAAGANGTPTFFINGRPLRGARPLEDFVEIVDEELKRANELIAAGTPVAEIYSKRASELVAQAGGPNPAQ